MTTGERIKLRREELGLSKVELARRVGYTKSAITKIENRGTLKPDKIADFAEALNTTVSALVDGDSMRETISLIERMDQTDKEILNRIIKLDQTDKCRIRDLVDGDSIRETISLIERMDQTDKEILNRIIKLDQIDKCRIRERLDMMLENEKYHSQNVVADQIGEAKRKKGRSKL